MVWRAGLEPARTRYSPVLHRAYCTPGFTERNGTIHGPAGAGPDHRSRRSAQTWLSNRTLFRCRAVAPDRYISRPDLQEILLSFAFCRMSSRFRAILTAGSMTPLRAYAASANARCEKYTVSLIGHSVHSRVALRFRAGRLPIGGKSKGGRTASCRAMLGAARACSASKGEPLFDLVSHSSCRAARGSLPASSSC